MEEQKTMLALKKALDDDSVFRQNTSLYCVLDLKSGVFQKVFEVDSDVNAIRSFYSAVGSKSIPGNSLTEYPFDFALVKLADLDNLKGLFNVQTSQLCLGSEARAFNLNREREVDNENRD